MADKRIEVARTPACEELEEDLAGAARVQREGGDLAAHYSALARHLDECEWCRATLAELVKEPDVLSEAETEVDSSDHPERYLAAALAEPERIIRLRAAQRLGATRRVGPTALAALAEAAADDPDADVRAAALAALEASPAVAEARGTLSAEEGELRLVLEGLPPSFEQTTPVVAVPGAGLVAAQAAVRDGRLDLRLERLLDPAAPPALERVFVLRPQA